MSKQVKDKIIQTMVTEDVRDTLQQEACALGLSMSAYIRSILMSRQSTKIYNASTHETAEVVEEQSDTLINE